MAIENDVSELRRRQKSKNRRNFLIKFFAVLTVAVLVVIAVLTKDSWYPYLDGILTKVPAASDNTDNAELAEGKFPIAVSGGSDYQLKAMDNYFAFLDDSKFFVYTADGEPVIEKQHTYANPILTVSNKKALIYDLGGNGFSLESKYKTIYEKTCDQTILMAELSSSDLAAVVTKSDKYLAQLDIYDSDGKNIFTYKSYDSRITDVTFLNDNSGCIITTLGASGGKVQSGLIRFSFNSTEMIWQSEKVDCLAVCTPIDANGDIIGYYSNGQNQKLWQIPVCRFTSEDGLYRQGGNLYSATEASGNMTMGVAGTENFGTINSYSLEMSNVDMATEMVNLIVTQRGFQSNSKVITTADEMLRKAMEIKRT